RSVTLSRCRPPTAHRGIAAPTYARRGRMWPSTRSAADVVGALVQGRIAFDALTEDLVDPAEQISIEFHSGGLHVVVHLIGSRGPDDGRGHVLVLQHPCHGQLCQGQPGLVGQGLQPLDPLQEFLVAHATLDVVFALRVDRAGSGGRFPPRRVLAAEKTPGDGGPHALAEALAFTQRHDLALDDPPEHVVLRLAGDETIEAPLLAAPESLLDLVCAPLGDPHVEDLALTDEV